MYKLITSAKDTNDLSLGFDPDRGLGQHELTNDKIIKGKYHVRITMKDIFGFAEHQKKATYGKGYILTLTRNTDNAVLNKDNAINSSTIKIIAIEWYAPQYTPSVSNQAILSNRTSRKTPTELQYVGRSVFMKELNTQNFWTFELGIQESNTILIWIMVNFQQRDRQDSQN